MIAAVDAASNKVVRKKAMTRLTEAMEREEDVASASSEALPVLYRCLEDEGERCREMAANAIEMHFSNEAELHHVVSVVHKRMLDCSEPSEEVRLSYVKALAGIAVKKSQDELKPYMDEFREISIEAAQVYSALDHCARKLFVE